jgi:Bacteriophage lambda head decoration protein D
MSITLNSPSYASDWLKGEGHAGEYFSRDTVVIASGQGVLTTGTVLAQLTANGKFVVAATGTTDGSQIATAILFNQSLDATSADQPAIVIARQATVSHQGLIWGSTINSAPLRAAAAAQLASKGIIDRQGA